VLLLNVELPDMSGFDVLRAVRTYPRPLSIMITPRADQAAAAFAEGALDYLIQPVSSGRFDQAMDRARRRFNSISAGALPEMADTVQGCRNPPMFLVGERQHRLYPLDPLKIDYIESDANYVTIRSGNCEYISRDSIKRLSAALSDLAFVRIERSLLVNIRAVSYVEMAGHGSYAFTLASGACLYSSPTYRDAILRILPLSQRSCNRSG
jgi:two-component system, LytTR family, response regulator